MYIYIYIIYSIYIYIYIYIYTIYNIYIYIYIISFYASVPPSPPPSLSLISLSSLPPSLPLSLQLSLYVVHSWLLMPASRLRRLLHHMPPVVA